MKSWPHLALLLLAACGEAQEPAPACVFGQCEPGWHTVFETEAGSLLSVTAQPDGRLFAVGGPLGNARADLVVTQAEDATLQVSTSLAATTHWWTWMSPDGDALMVGEKGEIWRHRPGTDSNAREGEGLTADTLFGVWGASADDVWAVGGAPLAGGDKDVVLHFDGQAWTRVTLPEPKGIAFYKVWGRGRDDVWLCGQDGWLLRVRGGPRSPQFKWYRAQPGRLVFTVAGNAEGEVWAVATPLGLYRYDAAVDAFETVEPPFEGGALNGVSVSPDGQVWVVGSSGTKWQRRADGEWVDHTLEEPRGIDLHAVYATDDGAAVVGGRFNDPARSGEPRAGVLGVFNAR